MRAVDLIGRTRDRQPLSAEEWDWFVRGHVRGAIPDYQMAAMLMAVRLRGITRAETFALTTAMAASGVQLDLSRIGAVDKHSTGGVGDKVTLAVAPMAAACGMPVAKMSGRGLAHTGGTLDKLEAIPGLRVALSREEFLSQVERIGLVIAGQSDDLAPADRGMYALRDTTGTVQSLPLIAASIMSKKLAAGAPTILLDVKTGGGALLPSLSEARHLARLMVAIGRDARRRTAAMITDMDEPLGRAVGNALELAEALALLRGEGPTDLAELCEEETAHLLTLSGRIRDPETARTEAKRVVQDGSALAKFREMVVAQGGDPSVVDDPTRLPAAFVRRTVTAPPDTHGYIGRIDALRTGRLAMDLGAGRATKEDAIRHDTGIVLLRVHGDPVEPGTPLAELHAPSEAAAENAAQAFLVAVTFSAAPPSPRRIVIEEVGMRRPRGSSRPAQTGAGTR